MVLKLSINAQKSFEDYINQVKVYLKGAKSVDAEEIQKQITEHIENELIGATEPVDSESLNEVLRKLGNPQQWVPEEEITWWKKFVLRIRTGPEDWRLAYLSFALFIIGLLFPPSFLVLLPASFIVSRASLSVANERDELSSQKWFIYPSLITVYITLLIFILSWPLIPIFCLWVPKYSSLLASISGTEDIGLIELTSFIVGTLISAASLGIIWIGYGLILLSQKRQCNIQAVFKPFADKFNKKWNLVFICFGIFILVISIITSYIINYFKLVPEDLMPDKLFF